LAVGWWIAFCSWPSGHWLLALTDWLAATDWLAGADWLSIIDYLAVLSVVAGYSGTV
jgi:hypothetical protein